MKEHDRNIVCTSELKKELTTQDDQLHSKFLELSRNFVQGNRLMLLQLQMCDC